MKKNSQDLQKYIYFFLLLKFTVIRFFFPFFNQAFFFSFGSKIPDRITKPFPRERKK